MTAIVNLLRVFVDNKNQQYYGVVEQSVQICNICPFPAMDWRDFCCPFLIRSRESIYCLSSNYHGLKILLETYRLLGRLTWYQGFHLVICGHCIPVSYWQDDNPTIRWKTLINSFHPASICAATWSYCLWFSTWRQPALHEQLAQLTWSLFLLLSLAV